MQLHILQPNIPVNIAPQSAIVASEDTPHIVYFEGNLFNAVNLQTYWERLKCAAGRLITRYPTSALQEIQPSDYTVLGYLQAEKDPFALYIKEISNPAALSNWAQENIADIMGPVWDAPMTFSQAMQDIVQLKIALPSIRNNVFTNRLGQKIQVEFNRKHVQLL